MCWHESEFCAPPTLLRRAVRRLGRKTIAEPFAITCDSSESAEQLLVELCSTSPIQRVWPVFVAENRTNDKTVSHVRHVLIIHTL